MADLSAEVVGIALENPTILASGILGVTYGNFSRAKAGGAAALTTKSVGLSARDGHPNPTLVECGGCFLNAVGLSNPGVDAVAGFISESKTLEVPIIASVFGKNGGEFAELCRKLEASGASAVELNVSCPNVSKGDGVGELIGKNPQLVAEVTAAVKKAVEIPVIVKLTPNVCDIAEIGVAAEKAGADALCAINTVGPGMKINVDAKKPVLANKLGGVSGPAIKPVTIAAVYRLYEKVDIPIIATGGITTGLDAVEAFMAGASAVGVGTGVFYRGFDVFAKIARELEEFMDEKKYYLVDEMIGVGHEKK